MEGERPIPDMEGEKTSEQNDNDNDTYNMWEEKKSPRWREERRSRWWGEKKESSWPMIYDKTDFFKYQNEGPRILKPQVTSEVYDPLDYCLMDGAQPPYEVTMEKQSRDVLTSNLDGRQQKLPLYHDVISMNPEIRRNQSLQNVANSPTSPYRQKLYANQFFQVTSDENLYAMDGALRRSYAMDNALHQGRRGGNQNSRRKDKNLAIPHDLESLRSDFITHYRSPSFDNNVGSLFNHFNNCITSVDGVTGRIFYLAMDRCGCFFLEKILTQGNPEDIGKIFIEIVDNITELMTDSSGNILVRKLLEVCNEEQKLQIVRAITRDIKKLITISCHTYGSRVVQKVIETLQTIEQISLILSSLQLGIVQMMKSTNGNHVLQCCLQHFPFEFREHLYDAAIAHCAELAVDHQGCFVLQKCIRYSNGSQKNLLMYEICYNSYYFSQDSHGNYVVKCVIQQEVPWATTIILGQLGGKYEELAVQKYSSNVVEECLKRVNEECLAEIIHELISSHFLKIALDRYGNYVIQTALKRCKGTLLYDLVEAIRPHIPQLDNHQYGKNVVNQLQKICFKLGFGVLEHL